MSDEPRNLPDLSRDHISFLSSYSSQTFIIDLRPCTQFTASHVVDSCGIPGSDTLPSRFHELPPPANTKIGIIATSILEATTAANRLAEKGYQCVPLQWPLSLPVVTGPWSRILWKPAPVLQTVPLGKSALDIGCGCGRDAKYLSVRGVDVVAVDRDSQLLSKLDKLRSTMYYYDVIPDKVGTITTIHRTFGADRSADTQFLRSHASDLLLVVRFLRRGVLDLLYHAVLPGGYVAYEHFLVGAEHYGGPRKRSQLLEMGELRTVFSAERGFVVIRDERCLLEDGRPVVRFVAHKPYT